MKKFRKFGLREKKALLHTIDDNLMRDFPLEVYGINRGTLRETRRELLRQKKEAEMPKRRKVSEEVAQDKADARAKVEARDIKRKYDQVLKENEKLSKERDSALSIKRDIPTFEIKPRLAGQKSEGTVVVVASDWHIEEKVDPRTINGLNEYSLDISRSRAEQFFKIALRLTQIEQSATDIKTMVLALLGDFFTNDIHEELAEVTALLPVDAVLRAQEYIASGIQFLLDNSDLNLVIPCHSGNHARTTHQVHISTEAGHSLEYMMYHTLREKFESNPRVKFIIPVGYHSYVTVYNTVIRFHHGHDVRYGGGVGGIYIPVNKAIANWNQAKRADIDVFGHFHQLRDGGNFISNGSLIGYNAYALSIKASFERPQQAFFLIHSKLGKILTRNIVFE